LEPRNLLTELKKEVARDRAGRLEAILFPASRPSSHSLRSLAVRVRGAAFSLKSCSAGGSITDTPRATSNTEVVKASGHEEMIQKAATDPRYITPKNIPIPI
jgi:hypothetical protein